MKTLFYKEEQKMTERLKGVYVAFNSDIREDDAEYIINAIKMIKGVLSVETNVNNADDWINRQRVSQEFKEKLYKLIDELK
jgi:hypothetical protein